MTHFLIIPVYPVLVLLACYYDVFITGDLISTHDTINTYAAFNYFMVNLSQGHVPLWDPYSYSGAPFYKNFNILALMDPTVLISLPFIHFFNTSTLDLFHFQLLIRDIIIYTGCYSLFHYITKNKWAALFGSTVVLFVLVPNTLWQQYSTLVATYSPWIMRFILQILSPKTSTRTKGWSLMAACYLIGLSLHVYIPSLLFFYLSMALIYLLIRNPQNIFNSAKAIKVKYWALGFILILVMGGPFLYSLSKMLSPLGEDMSLRRFSYQHSAKSETMAHTEEFMHLQNPPQYGVTSHNLFSLLIPGPDNRYFDGHIFYSEVFLTFGIFPLVIILLFFKQAKSEHKGLFLFLFIATSLVMLWPGWLYENVFKYYPGIKTVTQFHLFIGFFIITVGSLVSISLTRFFDIIFSPKENIPPSYKWLALIITGHIVTLYLYLVTMNHWQINRYEASSYLHAIHQSFSEDGWIFIVVYIFLGVILLSNHYAVRRFSLGILIGITMFQLVDFALVLRRYVTQPSLYAKSYVHFDRAFSYEPVRVPYVPRHSTFWLYLSSLYQVPSAIPTFFNSYNVAGRHSYDLIRFTSADRQKFLSGIGKRRFGFFNQYVVADNSTQALNMIGRMPLNKLHDTLVLEVDPSKVLDEVTGLIKIKSSDIELLPKLIRATHQRMKDYYDHLQKINFNKSTNPDKNGFLHFPLTSTDSARAWQWEKKNIGFFQVLFGQAENSNYYNPFNYFPNPGIRTGYNSSEESVCYADFSEWITKHVLPGFYKAVYDKPINTCDISLQNNELLVSPEIQGAFYTDDMWDPERDSFTEGFYVASLDPEKVTPNSSPYPRDELTQVTEFGPNFITFKINNSKPGFFYYADSYAKDWKAYLDQTHTPILRANFNFKAIYVPAGEHKLSIKYQPRMFIFLFWSFILVSIPGLSIPIRGLTYCMKDQQD